jgi:putative oxidoreductase
MSIFRLPSERAVAAGLLLLRSMLGVMFIAHGSQKLFMMGIPAVVEGFTQAGVPMPAVAAPGISVLEVVGGGLLIIGLITRVVAVLLACDMTGAIAFVHLKAGFFLPNGYELVLLLGVLAIVLVITGAGPLSIDGAIGRRDLPPRG